MMRRSVAILTGLVLVCGCAKSGAVARHPDACALMPERLAEQVLGVDLTNAASQGFGENPRQVVISNCLYLPASADDAALKSLTLTIRTGTVQETAVNPAETHIMTMQQQFGERYQLAKIDGLGDGAVWDESLGQLSVFRNGNTYVWAAGKSSMPGLREKLIELARRTIEA